MLSLPFRKQGVKMELESFNVIGISIRTTNENNQSVQDILGLWNTFLKEGIIDKIPNKISTEIFSIYTDYQGDYIAPYTTILGCKVSSLDSVPEGMVGKKIPAGKYVKKLVKGNLNEGVVFAEWEKIWNSDLDRAYTADFEVYGQKASNPEKAEIDIFVAVK